MIKKNNLSHDDQKTWENYIKNPNDIYDKDYSNAGHINKKDRYKFDLHGFTLDEANQKVKEIIYFCSEKKFKEILLITGKGIHSKNDKDIYISKNLGKMKYSVPEFINSNKELRNLIISINEADIKNGGEGAIIIKLKKL